MAKGSISLSGRHAENLGASKVFIVSDSGVRKSANFIIWIPIHNLEYAKKQTSK